MKSYSTVRELVQAIVETRALSVVEMMIDQHLEERPSLSEDEKWLLNTLKSQRDLDRLWMFAHTYLGNHSHAHDIRLWIDSKAERMNKAKKAAEDLLGGIEDELRQHGFRS